MTQVLSMRSNSVARSLVEAIQQPAIAVNFRAQAEADTRLQAAQPALVVLRQGGSEALAIRALTATGFSESTARRRVNELRRWLNGDHSALAPKYHGRPITPAAWHVRAIQIYRQRSQPSAGDITAKLWAEGVRIIKKDGTPIKYLSFVERVRKLLQALPADQGEYSAARLGASYRQGNHLPRKRRDVSDIAVGDIWVSDGHKLKVLCRNALSGNFYRLEITPILDLRSNYWFSTWFAGAESGASVVNLFCSTVRQYQKVPLVFYTDNGSGFKNKRTAAMFSRLGTTHLTAQPGAPYSKGQGENVFRQVINKFARIYWPDAYCGTDVTDDVIARYHTKWKRGELYIPTDREVMASVRQYRVDYNAKPQPYSVRLAGAAPDDLITQLEPDAVPVPPQLMLWEERTLAVRRATVAFKLNGEHFRYSGKLLTAVEGERVVVMYDGEDASRVWVRDGRGVYLGEVARNEDVGFAHPSVYAAIRLKHRDQALARKELMKAKIVQDFDAMHVIEHDSTLPVYEQIQQQGHSLTIPVGVPQRPAELAAPINPATLERIRHEDAELAAATRDEESPAERFAWALRCEAAVELSDQDAERLKIYQTSAEYRAYQMAREWEQEQAKANEYDEADAATPASSPTAHHCDEHNSEVPL